MDKQRDFQHIVTDNRLVGLLRMMRGYRFIYLVALISLAVASLARTSIYLWLQYFIDEVLPSSPTSARLFWVGMGFIGLALFQGFFTFVSGALAARTAEGIVRELRNYLFDHIQRLTFTYHDQTPTGELIQRSTSDVDALRRFFADQIIGLGRILLLFSLNFAAIYSISPVLAWRSIVVIPLIIILSYFFFRKISKLYESYQEQEAVLSTTLQENLSGTRVVKAFARQAFEREKFERENWGKFVLGRRLLTMHAFYWPLSDILASFQMIAGLAIGALMTIDGTLSIGSYVAYTGMLIWIIWPMRNLGRLIVQTSMGVVSYTRVVEVIRQVREPMDVGIDPQDRDSAGQIIFNNIGFAYEDGSPVLENISFECEPGDVIGLLGPTGSGKTTLVNLIPRFYDYTDGSLQLDGVELNEYSRLFLRQQIGIVEQEPFLFSRTIRENITLGVNRDLAMDEIEAAAHAAAIHETIMTFSEGYETLVGEKGVTLSGGQKQRIAIARTLLKDPCILILDDSTSSVDTLTETEIREALNRLMENRTTFIIAHRIQSVMNADQILVLDKGKIVQHGVHEELIAEDGIYQKVHKMQTQIEDALEQELTDVGS
ncbi:MAG: ATP-binding cassette domain-containing protein [Anaerolineales bacterium]|nr:ATP-binding cassette domain-containing protein [Anaerolineales bacterium]